VARSNALLDAAGGGGAAAAVRWARVCTFRPMARFRHPPIVTAALIGAVAAVAFRLGVMTHGLPLRVAYARGFSGRAVISGRWTTVPTSQLLTRDTFMAVSIVLSLAIMLGLYEAAAGWARAAAVAISSALAGPLVVTAVLGIGSALGIAYASRTLETLDYGASAITAGGGGALVCVLGDRRLRIAAMAFVLGGLLLHHQLADWEHLVAFPLGYGIARVSGTSTMRWPACSRGIRRPLMAAASIAVAGALGVVLGFDTIAAPAAPHAPNAAAGARSPTGARLSTIHQSPGRLVVTTYPSPSTHDRRRVLVYLPAGYDSTLDRYPAVELLHGSPGGPEDPLTGIGLPSRVDAMPDLPRFIAVSPDGHGPAVREGDFADTSRQRLGAALSDDLRQWADATFRTDGHWSVTGLSSGGFGAAYLAMRTPGAYDRVCAMSGYFEARDPAFTGEPAAVRIAASPIAHVMKDGPPTLLIVGNRDPDVEDNRLYAAAMTRVGQPNTLAVLPGNHGWPFWRAHLPGCLRFLLATSAIP
jgi:enterochelin esterase-like enzyme